MNQERLLGTPLFGVADRLEATLEANLHRATRLRQAILKKAFSFVGSDQNRDGVVMSKIEAIICPVSF